jgi:hypothetical protein
MSEQIAIEQGRVPWAPAADTELVRTLHIYDMPLIGVVRQGDSMHLFRCIEGHVDDTNLWAYTAVDDAIERVVAGRPVDVALASERDGITASALVREPGRYPTLLHAAREALRALSDEIDLKLTALG